MIYSEAAYFEGHPCQHVADYLEAKRLERKRRDAVQAVRLVERRRNGRAMYRAA